MISKFVTTLAFLSMYFFDFSDSYNMNNFPIIKRLFDKKHHNNYSKKTYVNKYANNYAINKIVLDEMAANIVGPKKNNSEFSK
jgi:hypothetical protein